VVVSKAAECIRNSLFLRVFLSATTFNPIISYKTFIYPILKYFVNILFEYSASLVDKYPTVMQPERDMNGYVNYDKNGLADGNYHVQAYEFLSRSGFKDWKIIDSDVRVDEERGMVGFPYRDKDGNWAGMLGRSYLPNLKTDHFCYTVHSVCEGAIEDALKSRDSIVWYREYELEKGRKFMKNRPTIVVQNPIDAALIGEEATAMFGLTASETMWKFFKNTAGVVFLGDSDRNGNDLPEFAVAREDARLKCGKLKIPFYDIYYPVGFKDVGEICMKDRNTLEDMLENFYLDFLRVKCPNDPIFIE
jgi:hypothetical protein